MDSIPLRITLDELDGFIKVYDGIKYLVLFGGVFMIEFTTELNIF